MIVLSQERSKVFLLADALQIFYVLWVTYLVMILQELNIQYIVMYMTLHQMFFSQLIFSARYLTHQLIEGTVYTMNILFLCYFINYSEHLESTTILYIFAKLVLYIPYVFALYFYS